ncbi:MAG: hypothetical protein OXS28_15255 [Gammaproteobacteria bacterium]|nr:hypothetical protein [Gammaproteobacteria bacterium]
MNKSIIAICALSLSFAPVAEDAARSQTASEQKLAGESIAIPGNKSGTHILSCIPRCPFNQDKADTETD